MSGRRAKHLRAAAKLGHVSVNPNRAKRLLLTGTPVVLLAALGIVACLVFFSDDPPATPRDTTPALAASIFALPEVTRKAETLNELLTMTPSGSRTWTSPR